LLGVDFERFIADDAQNQRISRFAAGALRTAQHQPIPGGEVQNFRADKNDDLLRLLSRSRIGNEGPSAGCALQHT
jgi:hypothetical protein